MVTILAIHPVAQATLWLALTLAVGALGVWVVARLRGSDAQDTQDAHQALTKFRELHARGGLSDEEYRTIKTKLATQLEVELGESTSGDPLTDSQSLRTMDEGEQAFQDLARDVAGLDGGERTD